MELDHWRNLVDSVATTPWIAVIVAALVRFVMGYDATPREVIGTLIGGAFLIFFIAPGVAEWLRLGPAAAASAGATMALIGRPVVALLIRLATAHANDPQALREYVFGKRARNDPRQGEHRD